MKALEQSILDNIDFQPVSAAIGPVDHVNEAASVVDVDCPDDEGEPPQQVSELELAIDRMLDSIYGVTKVELTRNIVEFGGGTLPSHMVVTVGSMFVAASAPTDSLIRLHPAHECFVLICSLSLAWMSAGCLSLQIGDAPIAIARATSTTNQII